MRICYNVLTFFLSLACGVVFACNRRGRQSLAERFGLWTRSGGSVIHLHGASVGEINGLLPLIPLLRERYPDDQILVTATSTTGLSRAEGHADFLHLLPFDCELWLAFALRQFHIKLFIFSETELWPASLWYMQGRSVPCYMVNAVISDFTFKRYSAMRFLFRPIVRRLTGVASSDKVSAERMQTLGATADTVVVVGNAKFDSVNRIENVEKQALLSRLQFANKPTVVLGSVRPGEEAFWLQSVKRFYHEVQWIIAPRHMERIPYFCQALSAHGLSYRKYSLLKECSAAKRVNETVLLVDTMGVLSSLYACADLAFIGGSMVPGIGGHSPLEAMVHAVPITIGRYHENVALVVTTLLEKQACFLLESEADVAALVLKLLNEKELFLEYGARGLEVYQSHQGAAQRIVTFIESGHAVI